MLAFQILKVADISFVALLTGVERFIVFHSQNFLNIRSLCSKCSVCTASLGFPKMGTSRNLAVFDFDHTIVEENTDIAVMKLVDTAKIPEEIRSLRRSDGWTAFMQGNFKYLHENEKTENDIKSLIQQLPPVPGMCQLIEALHANNYDVIIISDCNSYFIDVWLRHRNLHDKVLKVFTNPAEFNEQGMLKISMYHLQDYCKLSTKNLCKGQILEDFIAEQKKLGIDYEQIIYAGDGMNDFCPILRLRECDLACVRDKFACVDVIKKTRAGKSLDENGEKRVVKAEVLIWNTGDEIQKKVLENNKL